MRLLVLIVENRYGYRTSLTILALGTLLVCESRAQAPAARVVASLGVTRASVPVWETHVAMSQDALVLVHNVGPRTQVGRDIGYAWAILQGGQWVWQGEGIIPRSGFNDAIDPSVAYSAATNEFVVAALVGGYPSNLGVAHWKVGQGPPFAGGFTLCNPTAPGGDKPWIVAGEGFQTSDGLKQEYYILYNDLNGAYRYLRSKDGGHGWEPGAVTPPDFPAYGGLAAQPAVLGSGTLYVAYRATALSGQGPVIRVLAGTDAPDGKVDWVHLRGVSVNDPLEIPLLVADASQDLPLPGNYHKNIETIPQIAVDPTSPDRLFIAYHDRSGRAVPNDVDVDVKLARLERQLDGRWTYAVTAVNDADDPLDIVTDQFLPAIAVDHRGHVHVTFYDDRRSPTQTDVFPVFTEFDVYYAISTDHGSTFPLSDEELYSQPDERALQFFVAYPPDFEFGEYIGLTTRPAGESTEVWAGFHGTHAADPTQNKSVIWASRIFQP